MNYLALLNGVIITDMVVIVMLVFGVIQSKSLKEWYNKFSLGGFISDIFSIMFGILLANFIYPYLFDEFKLVKFIILAVVIQLAHDILFALFLTNIPLGTSKIIDTFKNYAGEHGLKILPVDSTMIISTILISTYLSDKSTDINMLILITMLYLLPYFLYSV
jgi:hypothetical protein